MKKLSQIEKVSNNLVKAFLKNKIIAPIPSKFVKNSKVSEQLRKLCESKIKKPVIGFKAGGTGIPVLKKLGEKEPFYASVFKHNFLKNGQSIKIHKYTLGIELEVCYLIKKTLFATKGKITLQNIKKYISHIAPCIEVVGYRQRKKGIKSPKKPGIKKEATKNGTIIILPSVSIFGVFILIKYSIHEKNHIFFLLHFLQFHQQILDLLN